MVDSTQSHRSSPNLSIKLWVICSSCVFSSSSVQMSQISWEHFTIMRAFHKPSWGHSCFCLGFQFLKSGICFIMRSINCEQLIKITQNIFWAKFSFQWNGRQRSSRPKVNSFSRFVGFFIFRMLEKRICIFFRHHLNPNWSYFSSVFFEYGQVG